MRKSTAVISYILSALSGICFIGGISVLNGRP